MESNASSSSSENVGMVCEHGDVDPLVALHETSVLKPVDNGQAGGDNASSTPACIQPVALQVEDNKSLDDREPTILRVIDSAADVKQTVSAAEEDDVKPSGGEKADTDQDADIPLIEEKYDFEIVRMKNGSYQTAFHVARVYFKHLIGDTGSTRRCLEEQTSTQICIPKRRKGGDLVITGPNEGDVAAARQLVNLKLLSLRQQKICTHFFSIPMNGEQIKKRFLDFKNEVCELCKDHRIDESIFQLPERLHLTLGTIFIADTEECNQVEEMLISFKETVALPMLNNQPLKLHMVGVECMNDKPCSADILYGKIQPTNGSGLDVLQNLADSLVDFFVAKGVIKKQFKNVKLHVTLMNSLFRKKQIDDSDSEKPAKKRRVRESFDASTVVKTFENYDFGEQLVDAIHLSQRFTTATDGYYQTSAQITFM